LNKAVDSGVYEMPLQAMGDHMPFPDHSFASALSNSVLEHIPDIQPVLNEIGRVLQPGAPFVITVPSHLFSEYLGGAAFFNRLGLDGMADRYRKLFNHISRHAHTDPPEVWAERLAKAGLQIERWQYYFSREALRTLEIGHAQGVPSAITHALTGHWIIGPYESNLKWTERWVRPYYEEEFPERGAYIFFLARKASDTPLEAALPAARPFSVAELNQSEINILVESTVPVNAQHKPAGKAAEEIAGAAVVAETMSEDAVMETLSPDTPQPAERQKIISHRWIFLLSILLALLVPRIAGSGSGFRPFAAIAFWIVAAGGAFYALYIPQSADKPGTWKISRFTLITSILLFLTALIVRLYDLEQHPFILNGTEASLGLDVLNIINGPFRSPFSTGWLTNPTLPLFLLAIPIKLLGPSVLSLRLLSPFVGAVTVVATFLIGQRLYGRNVGLAAAVLMLGSYFHIHFSRLGLTNAWDALLVLLSLGFIAIAWQQEPSQNRLTWLLAGLAIGLSAYLYTSSHLLPLMLLSVTMLTLVFNRQTWQKQWPNIVAMATLALIVSLPQLLGYWANPGTFVARADTLGILDSQSGWLSREAALTGASQMQIFGKQLWSAAMAFNATLDTGTSFGPLKPLLNLASGLLAAVGFFLAVIRLRKIQFSILVVWVVVVIIFAGALLVSPPNSHRYIIAAPAVSLLAAIGLVELITALVKRSKEEDPGAGIRAAWYQRKASLLTVALVITAVIALYDITYYFGSYRHEHHFADRNTEIADAMADYLNSLEGDWSAYFYGPPSMYVDFPTIPFLAGSYQKEKNLFDVVDPHKDLPLTDSVNYVFIYLPERYDEIAVTKSDFPSGQEKKVDGYYSEPLFHVYEVKDWYNLED
jgi:SAM-dependent methyltransferase/4-amino-4-deoxy-L-arabinose transferase-like glycosyltransferase